MARNRVIYQSEALYAAPTGAPTGTQITRVQDVSHTIDIARQDVNEFGKLAAISREVVDAPSVGTDFSYYLMSGQQEAALGLFVNGHSGVDAQNLPVWGGRAEGSAISGLISDDGNLFQRNLYVRTSPEGTDVAGATGNNFRLESAIGIGNAFITDYTLNAAVGDMPTVSVSTEAANMNVSVEASQGRSTIGLQSGAFTGTVNPGLMTNGDSIGSCDPTFAGGGGQDPLSGTQTLPAGSTGIADFACLRPGDLHLNVTGSNGVGPGAAVEMGGAALGDMHIQNVSFSLPLSRSALTKLGNKYPYYRAPDFPVSATMSVSAIMASAVAGNLSGILCASSGRDVSATFDAPCMTFADLYPISHASEDPSEPGSVPAALYGWSGTQNVRAFQIKLKQVELDSQNFSSSIGDNQTVDLTWSTQLGGPEDTENGVFLKANFTGATETL